MQCPAFGALLQVQAFQSLWNSRLESNVNDTIRGFEQEQIRESERDAHN